MMGRSKQIENGSNADHHQLTSNTILYRCCISLLSWILLLFNPCAHKRIPESTCLRHHHRHLPYQQNIDVSKSPSNAVRKWIRWWCYNKRFLMRDEYCHLNNTKKIRCSLLIHHHTPETNSVKSYTNARVSKTNTWLAKRRSKSARTRTTKRQPRWLWHRTLSIWALVWQPTRARTDGGITAVAGPTCLRKSWGNSMRLARWTICVDRNARRWSSVPLI